MMPLEAALLQAIRRAGKPTSYCCRHEALLDARVSVLCSTQVGARAIRTFVCCRGSRSASELVAPAAISLGCQLMCAPVGCPLDLVMAVQNSAGLPPQVLAGRKFFLRWPCGANVHIFKTLLLRAGRSQGSY